MDVQPIDLGDELRQGFQLRLALAPVVIRRPVACEFLHRRERHALGLICDGLLFGPLRGRDAATEVDECRFRNVDPEAADFGTGHGGLDWGHGALLFVDRASLGNNRSILLSKEDICSTEHNVSWGTAATLRGACGGPKTGP